MLIHWHGVLFLTAVFVFSTKATWPQAAISAMPAPLTSAQIVEELQRHNLARTEALQSLKSIRHYQAEYQGFSKEIVARMEVEYSYDARSGKRLRIVTMSGSKIFCDKVLKRAVDGEMEASRDSGASALTPANYKFHLAGIDSLGGRPAYVLDVEPLVADKFLYRGKIWVDASEFAVVMADVEPAKNPSFWISRTRIRQTFAETNGFWLPEMNRSETKVRIGGTAAFSIDYGKYEIVANAPLVTDASRAH
ncbi:MAG: hypothetical protein ABSE55_17075 [Terracidiphilus sp.]|jgi:hypothetical protein